MPRKRFFFRPIQKGLAIQHPSMHMESSFANWPTRNVIVDEYSIKKRPGYNTADRNLGSGIEVQHVAIFQMKDGTRKTLYLTPTNLAQKETGTNETWSYKTATYTTGTIVGISGTTVTGSGTSWNSAGLANGDKFVVDSDHSANIEEDADWRTISSITDNTHLELTTSHATASGTYKARKVYTTPTNERWRTAIVDDQFCFGNGNTNVQSYSGSGYASDCDTSSSGIVAINARYLIEYTNRLIIADYGTTRDPLRLAWSAEGDPNTFNASDETTAGSNIFLETESYITGLGKVGTSLVVYKREALIFGNRTGTSTAPINFSKDRPGIGCIAPNSIVHFLGKNAFVGRENFYVLESNVPDPIGEPIRYDFFSSIGKTEMERIWGYHNADNSTISWFANMTDGNFAYVWNYVTEQWTVFQFADTIRTAGRGAV